MHRASMFFGVFLFLFLFFSAGCSKQDGGGGASGTAGSGFTIGVTYQNLQNEFVVNIQDALRKRAGELGVTIIEADGQGRAEKQMAQVENFIVQQVDAVILNPFDTYACAPIVERVKKAGLPLVVLNAVVSNLEKADAYIGSDDTEAGRIEMQYIADRLGGKGKIAIIHGPGGHSAEIDRSKGVEQIRKKYPDIQVVAEQRAGWKRAKAMGVMENWLQTGKLIDAVIAMNDEMALGASKAIEATKTERRILVIGVDALPDALDAVESGQLAATVFQDARAQGKGAIELAVKLLRGEKVEHMNHIPFRLVTRENLDEYRGE